MEETAQVRQSTSAFARWLFMNVMKRMDVLASMREAVYLIGKRLHVGPHSFDLVLFRQIFLVSVGKAAIPMANYMLETLQGTLPLKGVVVGPGIWNPPDGIRYVRGDHPVPYANSYAAAQECIQLMNEADDQTLVVFLISGGASSMAEAPLSPSIPMEDLSAFYRTILYSGLPIGRANTLRKHFSAIKGGRLAVAAGGATRCTILISDVPEGELDVVGSGPSLADPSTVEECHRLLAKLPGFTELPSSLQEFAANMPETPKQLQEGRFPSVGFSLLSSASLIQATIPLVEAAGYRVVVDNTCDDWDYHEASGYLVNRAIAESKDGRPVCILSAGEVTVSIPESSGIGGRNQQWALQVARLIEGDVRFVAMSVGSDGIDGNSPAAGAWVDGTTWKRAYAAGFNAAEALKEFNAYPLFAALEDAITPGPLGNNIRDLRVILCNSDN